MIDAMDVGKTTKRIPRDKINWNLLKLNIWEANKIVIIEIIDNWYFVLYILLLLLCVDKHCIDASICLWFVVFLQYSFYLLFTFRVKIDAIKKPIEFHWLWWKLNNSPFANGKSTKTQRTPHQNVYNRNWWCRLLVYKIY